MPLSRRAVAAINRRLETHLGVRLLRVPGGPKVQVPIRPATHRQDRLLERPVFILSSVRAGSTLYRMLLDRHSQLHAPHETHFRRLAVELTTPSAVTAMTALRLNERDLEHLLWDRLLHRELVRSGKATLVEKTPSNVFAAHRLRLIWPDARFVYLVRHPYSVAVSWHEADPESRPWPRAIRHTLGYLRQVEKVRTTYAGLTVRYEELTSDPQLQTRRTCEFLDVPWEESMVTYGAERRTDFVKGLGDWREKIRTGTVQPGRPLPDSNEVPSELVELCRVWGY